VEFTPSQPENLVSINDAHCTQLIDLEQTVNNSGDQLASDDVLSEVGAMIRQTLNGQ
jgi:hypothetical protein